MTKGNTQERKQQKLSPMHRKYEQQRHETCIIEDTELQARSKRVYLKHNQHLKDD